MYNSRTKEYINDLFVDINSEVNRIVKPSPNTDSATQQIMEIASSKITAAIQGYMIDIYRDLSKQTLYDEIFKSPENANKFYELNLRQQISDAYQFDIQDLRSYTKGISYKEINKTYAVAVSSVGSAAVGGILLGVLSGLVNLPMVVVIAGAIACGIAGGVVANSQVDIKNKEKYKNAVNSFMNSLKNDLIKWVDDVIDFYNKKVNDLKASL